MLENRDYMRGDSEYGPNRWRTVTAALLILNAIVFVIQLTVPALVRDLHLRLSATGLQHGYFWQLITYQFLHADILHLLLNAMGVFSFGFAVEEALGKKRFVLLYLFSGVMGGLIQVLGQFVLPAAFGLGGVVGASAGLFGLIAAFALMAPHQTLTVFLFMVFPVSVSARVLAGTFLGISLLGIILEVTGFGKSSIAHGAHAGGMLGGWLMLRYFSRRTARETHEKRGAVAEPAKLETDFVSKDVDPILEKISKHGIQSLTAAERKTLEAARKKMEKR